MFCLQQLQQWAAWFISTLVVSLDFYLLHTLSAPYPTPYSICSALYILISFPSILSIWRLTLGSAAGGVIKAESSCWFSTRFNTFLQISPFVTIWPAVGLLDLTGLVSFLRLTVGFDGLTGPLQPKWFYDSVMCKFLEMQRWGFKSSCLLLHTLGFTNPISGSDQPLIINNCSTGREKEVKKKPTPKPKTLLSVKYSHKKPPNPNDFIICIFC